MTAATVTVCGCGHAERMHERDAAAEHDRGACMHGACACSEFRPGMTGVPAAAVRRTSTPPRPPASPAAAPVARPPAQPPVQPAASGGVASLIEAGRASSRAATRQQAERADAALTKLRDQLAEERRAAEAARRQAADAERARQEIAELEEQLRVARARVSAKRPAAHGSFPCPDCGRVLDTAQGLGSHRFRAHGIRKNPPTERTPA